MIHPDKQHKFRYLIYHISRYRILNNMHSEDESGIVHLSENIVILLFNLLSIYKTTVIGKIPGLHGKWKFKVLWVIIAVGYVLVTPSQFSSLSSVSLIHTSVCIREGMVRKEKMAHTNN